MFEVSSPERMLMQSACLSLSPIIAQKSDRGICPCEAVGTFVPSELAALLREELARTSSPQYPVFLKAFKSFRCHLHSNGLREAYKFRNMQQADAKANRSNSHKFSLKPTRPTPIRTPTHARARSRTSMARSGSGRLSAVC
jgi:hypothetical protein